MNHLIEEECGTVVLRPERAHNGYYAGDFSDVPFHEPDLRLLLTFKEYAS